MTVTAASTLNVILSRHGKLAEGERPTLLRKMSRTHLPALCRDLGFTKGAEIGVWKGAYSETFCREAPLMHLLCVDPWASYDEWKDGKNTPQSNIEGAYQETRQRLAGLNATVVRAFSTDVAGNIEDGSLDFCFIDGNHAYEHVLADLIAWVPKVRSGGLCCGHDFREFPHKPYIQVVPAVREFTKAHGIDPWFITAADKTPSWLWIVP